MQDDKDELYSSLVACVLRGPALELRRLPLRKADRSERSAPALMEEILIYG